MANGINPFSLQGRDLEEEMRQQYQQSLVGTPTDPLAAAGTEGALGTPAQQAGFAQLTQFPTAQQGMFSGPGMADLQSVYGILAGGADDPTKVGQQYVAAVQKQQQLDRQNQPIEQFLKLYGNVNPYDWTAESLQAFHNNYLKTGQLQFDLLRPKRGITSQETKIINEADEKAFAASNMIGRLGDIAGEFSAAAQRGDYTKGIVGTIDEWMTVNVFGDPGRTEALKQNWEAIRNSGVLDALPPGVASDRDIAIARKGWPGPNVDPAYLAAFARGLQKLKVLEYSWHSHKSAWISNTQGVEGGLADWKKNGRAWAAQALADNGLTFYNPKNPDGSKMSDEEAARFFFRRQRIGGGDPTLLPAGDTLPGPGDRPGDTPVRTDLDYNQMSSDDLIEEALR